MGRKPRDVSLRTPSGPEGSSGKEDLPGDAVSPENPERNRRTARSRGRPLLRNGPIRLELI
jgi:hypothetical protein